MFISIPSTFLWAIGEFRGIPCIKIIIIIQNIIQSNITQFYLFYKELWKIIFLIIFLIILFFLLYIYIFIYKQKLYKRKKMRLPYDTSLFLLVAFIAQKRSTICPTHLTIARG